MIEALDIRDPETARVVLEVQKSSYAVEAGIIGSHDIPPLHETLDGLRECGEKFHGYFLDGDLAGAISTKKRGHTLDIHRLFVSPEYFRRGIASMLLRHVEGGDGIEMITTGTGSRNEPAKRLYILHGFREAGEKEVAPGLWWTGFEKSCRVGL